MTDILIILLKPMLYFVYYVERGCWWKAALLFVPAAIGACADIIMNNTTVPMALGGGWFEEWTFSARLERLCLKDDAVFLNKDLCWQISLAINRVCPTHDHIKAVL